MFILCTCDVCKCSSCAHVGVTTGSRKFLNGVKVRGLPIPVQLHASCFPKAADLCSSILGWPPHSLVAGECVALYMESQNFSQLFRSYLVIYCMLLILYLLLAGSFLLLFNINTSFLKTNKQAKKTITETNALPTCFWAYYEKGSHMRCT